MGELVNEILLRLLKAMFALVLGGIVFLVAVGPLGQPGSIELALLAWIGGAAFILLVQESPI